MNVAEFNMTLERERRCGGCPMSGKGSFVGCDSSDGAISHKAVLFMGLNPGIEEARGGLPFIGPSGRLLREGISEAGIGSWGIANSLLCSSANEAAIAGADESRRCCHGNVARIFMSFRPRIVVPCGNGASSMFGLPSMITANSTKFFVSRGPSGKASPVLVLPMCHPSSVLRNGGKSGMSWKSMMGRLSFIASILPMLEDADDVESAFRSRFPGKILNRLFQNA